MKSVETQRGTKPLTPTVRTFRAMLYRDYYGIDLTEDEPEPAPEPQASDKTPHLDVIEEMLFYGMTEERLENLTPVEVATLKSVGWL